MPKIEDAEPTWLETFKAEENPTSFMFKDKDDAISFPKDYTKSKEIDPKRA